MIALVDLNGWGNGVSLNVMAPAEAGSSNIWELQELADINTVTRYRIQVPAQFKG